MREPLFFPGGHPITDTMNGHDHRTRASEPRAEPTGEDATTPADDAAPPESPWHESPARRARDSCHGLSGGAASSAGVVASSPVGSALGSLARVR